MKAFFRHLGKRYRSTAVVAAVIFALDQWTKHLVIARIPFGISYEIIPGYFDLIHTRNKGAAFGFLADMPASVRMPFFLATSLLTLLLMTRYFMKHYPASRRVKISLGLIVGGALGNIYDRLTLGEVVDFISWHIGDRWADIQILRLHIHFLLEWPAFNVADAAICLSMPLLLIQMLQTESPRGIHLP